MQQCPVCKVIIHEDKVHFNSGKPGSRERLYARVCQYAKKEGCINLDKYDEKKIKDSDYYTEPPKFS